MKTIAWAMSLLLLTGITFLKPLELRAGVVIQSSTLGAWNGSPVTVGSLQFTLLGYSGFSSSQQLQFQWFDQDSSPTTFTDDVYSLILSQLSQLTPQQNYTLSYKVQTTLSHIAFATAALDTNQLRGTTRATKDIYADKIGGQSILRSLLVNNGLPDGPESFAAEYMTIYVHDTLYTGANSYVASMSNTFTVVEAPEPGMVLIWSFLGALIISLRNRLGSRRSGKEDLAIQT